jgi:hypothetical protein
LLGAFVPATEGRTYHIRFLILSIEVNVNGAAAALQGKMREAILAENRSVRRRRLRGIYGRSRIRGLGSGLLTAGQAYRTYGKGQTQKH